MLQCTLSEGQNLLRFPLVQGANGEGRCRYLMRVLVLARSEKDRDYLIRLLKEGKGITFVEPNDPPNAIVVDADLLTTTERTVLKALIQHGSLKQAAKETHRTYVTLKKHFRSIRKKLRVKTNIQAVAVALRCRLVD